MQQDVDQSNRFWIWITAALDGKQQLNIRKYNSTQVSTKDASVPISGCVAVTRSSEPLSRDVENSIIDISVGDAKLFGVLLNGDHAIVQQCCSPLSPFGCCENHFKNKTQTAPGLVI